MELQPPSRSRRREELPSTDSQSEAADSDERTRLCATLHASVQPRHAILHPGFSQSERNVTSQKGGTARHATVERFDSRRAYATWHRIASMSELCFSSDGASAGSVGLRVTDSSGSVLVSAAADTVFSMPWSRGFAGTYSIMQAPENLRDLCIANSTTMASWAGSVVLSSSFYAPGCSYEKRAELAMQSGAAGLLFNGAMHSIFDWDGGSQADLAPSTVTLGPVYECVAAAVDGPDAAMICCVSDTPGPGV